MRIVRLHTLRRRVHEIRAMVEYHGCRKPKRCSALAQEPAPMKYLSRVVWSEGMYLGPHHFQVQSRYFEDTIRFATSSLWFEPWGFAGCALDPEALRNGTISLLHARGMFPGWTGVSYAGIRPGSRAASHRRSVSSESRIHHRPAYSSGAEAKWTELCTGRISQRTAHAFRRRKATASR